MIARSCDTLNSSGGNDALTGGAGADSVAFDTALNRATNLDTIMDFTPGTDRPMLSEVLIAGPAQGVLAAANFAPNVSDTATNGNDYIPYNPATGTVSYDADGNGGAAGIVFATLAGHPLLVAEGIHVGLS